MAELADLLLEPVGRLDARSCAAVAYTERRATGSTLPAWPGAALHRGWRQRGRGDARRRRALVPPRPRPARSHRHRRALRRGRPPVPGRGRGRRPGGARLAASELAATLDPTRRWWPTSSGRGRSLVRARAGCGTGRPARRGPARRRRPPTSPGCSRASRQTEVRDAVWTGRRPRPLAPAAVGFWTDLVRRAPTTWSPTAGGGARVPELAGRRRAPGVVRGRPGAGGRPGPARLARLVGDLLEGAVPPHELGVDPRRSRVRVVSRAAARRVRGLARWAIPP